MRKCLIRIRCGNAWFGECSDVKIHDAETWLNRRLKANRICVRSAIRDLLNQVKKQRLCKQKLSNVFNAIVLSRLADAAAA